MSNSDIMKQEWTIYCYNHDGCLTCNCHALDAADALSYATESLAQAEKEGENMELLELFNEKSMEVIDDFFGGLIEEEREKHPITKAYEEFVAKYSEENAEKNNGYIAAICLTPIINSDKIKWLEQQKDEWASSLQEIVNEVFAHLDLIDDDYDKIINVLKNYNVLDEKGKVNPLMPSVDDKDFQEYLKEQKKENE